MTAVSRWDKEEERCGLSKYLLAYYYFSISCYCCVAACMIEKSIRLHLSFHPKYLY
uniref:Uncharacterized protein n=1 Tax=Arundo donax TaxID=35708 RepID=A0A0A9DLM0_ARUDO